MSLQNQMNQIRNNLSEPLVRWIQEPAARPLVYAFKETPVTPNQVTALSALLGIAAAYFFSLGDARSMIQGGIIFEISRILDSVDGELARAKGMASDWGRIVDGIGDYVSSIAILTGLMIGLPHSRGELLIMASLIFLRGMTFDYFKENMMSRIKHGYDGSQRDIQSTYEKLSTSPSFTHKVYFYYLQLQQLLFKGHWTSFKNYTSDRSVADSVWPEDQRLNYYREKQALISLWKWNGPDLIFFLIILFSCFSILDSCLPWLSGIMAFQLVLTFILHHYLIRNEKPS
jgi:phosphatidylglycerophosphate synthase